jgi:hypothetical protein
LCILNLGLNYIPKYSTSHANYKKSLLQSTSNYIAQLKRTLYFAKYQTNTNSKNYKIIIPKIKHNPSWIPDSNHHPFLEKLDNYHQLINSTINNNLKIKSSISKADKYISNIIKNLSLKQNIIIKPADKNLGICVMSSEDYIYEALQILNNNNIYKIINKDTFSHEFIYDILRIILDNYDCLYDKYKRKRNDLNYSYSKLAQSLLQLSESSHLRTACKFYLLPKVHKTPINYRPIVSSVDYITYHTSKYLHNILYPLVEKLPNICLSSKNVICELQQLDLLNTNKYIITCADVKNLYPSIPTNFGINAVKKVLEYYPQYQYENIDLILDLLCWVLKNNYLEFNNTLYHQIDGTAMGTPIAPTYANIVLFYIESIFIDKVPNITYYRRYIDDLFLISTCLTSSMKFIDSFNSVNSSIQLDAVTHGNKGIFLDIEITINNNIINTKVYQKPDNKYLYLSPKSSHDSHVRYNFIFNEFQRYRLYTTDTNDYNKQCNLFAERLIKRGYKYTYIKNIMNKVPSRSSLLQRLTNKQQRINSPVFITHNPIFQHHQPCLKDIIKLPQYITELDEYINEYGTDNKRVIIAKRLGNPIRRLLCNDQLSVMLPSIVTNNTNIEGNLNLNLNLPPNPN